LIRRHFGRPLRVSGNNVRNTGSGVILPTRLTKNFDLHLGYANTVYAYQQTARSVIGYERVRPAAGTVPFRPAKLFRLLDRMEQLATLDLRGKPPLKPPAFWLPIRAYRLHQP
jgi:hypothetical protein